MLSTTLFTVVLLRSTLRSGAKVSESIVPGQWTSQGRRQRFNPERRSEFWIYSAGRVDNGVPKAGGSASTQKDGLNSGSTPPEE